MDTSSGNAILKPGTSEYKTAFEEIYGKKGPPEGFCAFPEPVQLEINMETVMAAKTGSIDTNPDDKRINVLMFRDHYIEFPELWLKVLVTGPPEDTRGFNYLFARGSCKQAKSIEDADLVVFTGGPDVDPALYGEKPHEKTYVDADRDAADIGTYMACVEQGVPMTGICRGAQFLAVMNNYKLFQDLDGHKTDHRMYCARTQQMIEKVSSLHHQCVRPGEGMELIAWTNLSTKKYMNDKDFLVAKKAGQPLLDVEAFFIRDTCCFGVQGHPEYKNYNAFAKWYLDSIYHLISMNSDLAYDKDINRLRIRPELLEERQLLANEIPIKQGA